MLDNQVRYCFVSLADPRVLLDWNCNADLTLHQYWILSLVRHDHINLVHGILR
jgi:hypothetical protein